jgi:16S rRNA C967 or C1407 C5-methylase (RsmB/RsmF family)
VETTKLPQAFCERVLADASIPNAQGLLDALSAGNPSVAIRYNRRKGLMPEPDAPRVAWWSERSRYFAERPQFTFDPAFHQGRYYVQDASSMAIGAVIESLGLTQPVTYLDACAAPGGKTTAAIDALPDGSFVLANEFEPTRAATLRDNLMKWGYGRVAVTVGDTARLRRLGADTFDVIAADVPCSGEGMMRKDPQAVAQWSPGLVRRCAELQREILENIWPLLRPGGHLIYSTCTFAAEEDERNVQWLVDELGAELLPLPFPDEWGVVGGHFYPHLIHGEGLYMALLRKSGAGRPTGGNGITEKLLRKAANVMTYGFETTELKGRDEIPTHALALSTECPRGKFPEVDVDRLTALQFLHRDAITLPPDTPRGMVLLTYQSHPLGWVKNLGNRANNLLPKHLRILSPLPPT